MPLFNNKKSTVKGQIAMEEARAQLQRAQDDMTALYGQLGTQISELEEMIMEDFDRGDEIEAEMHCYELQNAEAQRLICGKIRIKINEGLVDLKSTMAVSQASRALQNVKRYSQITPAMVESFRINSRSNSKLMMDLIGDSIDIKNPQTQTTLNKMKERYTQTRMSSPVSSSVEVPNNSATHKTIN